MVPATTLPLLLLLSAAAADVQTSCQDEEGNEVLWWFLLKKPQSYDYAYVTSADPTWWSKGSTDLASPDSLLAKNIAGIANSPWQVMYNDQPPANVSNLPYPIVDKQGDTYYPTGGHMKGALGAHYMVAHSIPRCCWHSAERKFAMGSSAEGQHAMCITGLGLRTAWKTMLAAVPHPFSPKLGPFTMPPDTPPPKHADAARAFKVIAKPPGTYATGEDMAAAHLAMGSALGLRGVRIQSWRLIASWGAEYNFPNSPSSQFDIAHVCRIQLPIKDFGWETAMADGTYGDHSKWAVGTDASGQQWFCAMDNNYACSQVLRGGGAYCLPDAGLAATMRGAIADKGASDCSPSNAKCDFRCAERKPSCATACEGFPTSCKKGADGMKSLHVR